MTAIFKSAHCSDVNVNICSEELRMNKSQAQQQKDYILHRPMLCYQVWICILLTNSEFFIKRTICICMLLDFEKLILQNCVAFQLSSQASSIYQWALQNPEHLPECYYSRYTFLLKIQFSVLCQFFSTLTCFKITWNTY